jgi:DNA-binding NarL/FixJ family response regulator
MPARTHSQPCVLLGQLEPIVSMGMTRMLVDGGVDVVTSEGDPSALVDHARLLAPEAVVLGLGADAYALAERVRTAAPQTKLILWAQGEDEMQVFDCGSEHPRRVFNGARHALLNELIAEPAREKENR